MKKTILFVLCMFMVFAAHTENGVKENNIALSELMVVIPDGEVRLVFWHKVDGMTSEKEAETFVLKHKLIRASSKEEKEMFFELYDLGVIKKHAKTYARYHYSYEGKLVETLPNWFVIVTKRP